MIESIHAALISAFKALFAWTGNALNVHTDDVWPVATTAPAKIAVTSASAQSAAITGTRCLIWCDEDVWYTAAADPTAAQDVGDFLPAFGEREVTITSGHKFAAILGADATGNGSFWIRVLV